MLLCVSVVDSLAWAYLVTNVLLTNHAAEVSTSMVSMMLVSSGRPRAGAKAPRLQSSKA
jgi:hypothetical protein